MSTLHDDRPRPYFQIDNAVIAEYLPLIGHTAYVVYSYLVYKADRRTHVAWPSYSKMQKELALGRNQVAESLKRLAQHGLITVEKGERAAVNHYHLNAVGSFAEKLVSPGNQSRSETETSFAQKPKLVSQRDSIKTQLSRPNYQEEINPESVIKPPPRPRTHEAGFSPANSSLTDAEIAADAAECGTTPAIFRGYIPQWADRRKAQGQTSADWRANLRGFVRAALEIAAKPGGGGGARASPVTFEAQKAANTDDAFAQVRRVVEGSGGDGVSGVRGTDAPPGRILPG